MIFCFGDKESKSFGKSWRWIVPVGLGVTVRLDGIITIYGWTHTVIQWYSDTPTPSEDLLDNDVCSSRVEHLTL